MSEQLKTCPWCDGPATISKMLYKAGWFVVECLNDECNVMAEACAQTSAEAIAAWNTRAPVEPSCTAAERALIEAAITDYEMDDEASLDRYWASRDAVVAERRAKEAK